MKTFNVGILGFGTVGGGTYDILTKNKELIEKRTGVSYNVSKILVRNEKNIKLHNVPDGTATRDVNEIIKNKDIDIVVEAIGGIEPATTWMIEALENGKNVVTPNKAAAAENFEKLNETAEKNGVQIRFEACVGGGIPALTAITEPLSGNRFTEVMGILNGTTNYILSRMGDEGLPYEEVLKDAQEKGFAEADPTADVEGIDCANKLSILIALAFGKHVPPAEIPTEGITGITMDDISKAAASGNKIKLISVAKIDDNGKIECEVKPTEIPLTHPLAGVNNEFNAVYVTGDAVDKVMLYGKGAGALPTGSAVVGDIIAIMRAEKTK